MIKQRKSLILYLPVIHQGYLDFLQKNQDKIDKVYLIDKKFVKKLSEFEPDIAALDTRLVLKWLKTLGFQQVFILKEKTMSQLTGQGLLLVNDQISRKLKAKYLSNEDIEFINVFLRWDREKVLSTEANVFPVVNDAFERKIMKAAYQEADNSSDWWRQIGAVLVKDGEMILKAYNQGLPDDHAPYKEGAVRDFLKVGEKPELANYIHAEQKIISEAAKQGIVLKRATLYVTHFPCPVCAKLIANAGISKLYFSEGSANLDGARILKSAKIKIKQVEGV